MTNPIPVNNNDEVTKLFAQKGEIVTQLEIAQANLQQVNLRLSQLLNIQQQPLQPTPVR